MSISGQIKIAILLLFWHPIVFGQIFYFSVDSINKLQHLHEELLRDQKVDSYLVSLQGELEKEELSLPHCFALQLKSQQHSRNNQFQKAEDDLIKIVRNIRNQNHEEYLAYFLKDLGGIYIERGRYYKAADELKQALNLARKYNQTELLIYIYQELSRITMQVGNIDESIKTYHKILQLQKRSNQLKNLSSTFIILSSLKAEKNDVDSAFYFQEQAEFYLSKNVLDKTVHEVKLHKSELFLMFGPKDSLQFLLRQLGDLMSQCNHYEHRIKFNLILGEFALQNREDSIAESYFDEAMNIAKTENVTIQKILVLSKISDAYYRVGMFKSAYESLKQQKRLGSIGNADYKDNLKKDLVQASEMNTAQNEIEILRLEKKLTFEKLDKNRLNNLFLSSELKFKTELLHSEELIRKSIENENNLKIKQLELNQLQQKELEHANEIQKLSIKRSNLNVVLFALLSALIAILTFFLYHLYKKQKFKHSIIERQSKELEMINKEVHHRVKNNLQVIASLLDLQSNSARSIELKEILQESKQRVQSMAFIHQNLYEAEGIQNVDMKGYINTLSKHLLNSYPLVNKKIEIELAIDSIQLQMDTVISIGMIVNELITNAIKYAFSDISNGVIFVGLQKMEGKLLLIVKDNGSGINTEEISLNSGFGYKIIRSFCQKLKATLNIVSESGTKITILIHKFK